MISGLELFKEELIKDSTNYFILDTHRVKDDERGDVDFVQYKWSPRKYNLVKEGDLFIYRRPSRSSETKEFYFFGACKIETITGGERVCGSISKKYPFRRILLQSDLEKFVWKFKARKINWANFFNQYGMNKITRDDFINLMKLSEEDLSDYEGTNIEDEVEALQNIQKGNFFVDDNIALGKVRSGQQAFSKEVKVSYNYSCAICGLKTKEFLVGSHIVPWKDNKNIRLDPKNGICLCVLHDKAFDKGYLTLDNNYRIILSTLIENDSELSKLLNLYKGNKIRIPKENKPKLEYLKYHREVIFENKIKKIIK